MKSRDPAGRLQRRPEAPSPESRTPLLILNYEELGAFCDQECGDKGFRSCPYEGPEEGGFFSSRGGSWKAT
jgi:hypothetical protein